MIHALVCDDYAPIANLVKIVLREDGIDVSTASDGTSALDLIRSLRPGLVISDIDMPGLTGLCMLKLLQSDATGLAKVPFILMSSADHQSEALKAGCNFFLTKPFSIEELRRIVAKALTQTENVPHERHVSRYS